jgi:hypothetical protein
MGRWLSVLAGVLLAWVGAQGALWLGVPAAVVRMIAVVLITRPVYGLWLHYRSAGSS